MFKGLKNSNSAGWKTWQNNYVTPTELLVPVSAINCYKYITAKAVFRFVIYPCIAEFAIPLMFLMLFIDAELQIQHNGVRGHNGKRLSRIATHRHEISQSFFSASPRKTPSK